MYELLGGRYRNSVRTYPAVFKFTPEDMAKACVDLKKKGFTSARLMITGDIREKEAPYEDGIYVNRVRKQIERVKACREAVGNDFDLILEVHRSMCVPDAIAFAKGVEEFHPLFLENPIAPDSNFVMEEVASKTCVPIATGERYISIQEFEDAARYVRPDVCALGGITPSKKVAAIAESHYAEIAPHNPLGPVSTAACLQLVASCPNVVIQEFPSFYESGKESGIMTTGFEIDRGYLKIPDAPGIGIELVENITELFPPAQRSINCQIAFDGSVRDI